MEETEGGLEQQCRAHKASCRPGRDYVFTDGRSITTVVLWTARRRDNHGLLTFWSCTLFDVFRRNKPQGQKDLSIHQFWHLNQKVLCVVTHECHCPPEQVWRAEALHFTEYASKAKTCWWSNPRPMNLILDMLDQQTPIFFLWHVLWQNPLCFRHEKCQWPYLMLLTSSALAQSHHSVCKTMQDLTESWSSAPMGISNYGEGHQQESWDMTPTGIALPMHLHKHQSHDEEKWNSHDGSHTPFRKFVYYTDMPDEVQDTSYTKKTPCNLCKNCNEVHWSKLFPS